MTTYIVTMVARENYDRYVKGYYDFGGSFLANAFAKSKEEARDLATRLFPSKVVVKVQTEPEAQAEEEARVKAIDALLAEYDARRARREADEARRIADAMNCGI